MPWHGTRHYYCCGGGCYYCCWCLNCDRCLQHNCIQSYWDTSFPPTRNPTCLLATLVAGAKYLYFIGTLRHFTKHWTDLLFSHFCSSSALTSYLGCMCTLYVDMYICVYFISLFSQVPTTSAVQISSSYSLFDSLTVHKLRWTLVININFISSFGVFSFFSQIFLVRVILFIRNDLIYITTLVLLGKI